MTIPFYKQACIFGGTGFIGRQITRELARQGYTIKVATRAPEGAYFLKTAGVVGQIVPFACDYRDEASIRAAVRGCDLVINCIGILYERGKNSFASIHTELPRAIAKACRAENVQRFIHISALGCDHTDSKYGKSKFAGERAVLENFPKATIFRPAVVFGVEDNFFNMFARLSVILPALPLIGGGATKMQPVYVGDIADAVVAALGQPGSEGQVYELGGPDILTFRDIYKKLATETGRPKALISLPWGIAKVQGCLLGLMPKPLLTADQVESLKTDSIVSPGALGLRDLGLSPANLDVILPTYLSRYRPGGRFGDKKRA
jgi:uncharacterized protein YbjT (DUF2867 family)